MELRMYFLTMYNISPIQQGIQCGHSFGEYIKENFNDPDLQDFLENHKTWIVLNGGTSNDGTYYELGSMEKHRELLLSNNIKITWFNEPDLNDSLTSICFLVDERVFSKEYLDFNDYMLVEHGLVIEAITYLNSNEKQIYYDEWLEYIGGEKNIFLREFLKGKRLA